MQRAGNADRFTPNHDLNRLQKNENVEKEVGIFYVVQVVTEFYL